ncbi:PAS domain-containing protein [Halopenitus persicus]|uniref:histidine kinase n=1 Tax=Halopenitus persicus TaxID=1048396 RepID=A0A1H3NTG0_9EURY|nr:PAS domain-containing protein [Halopenitus persicus]SDY92098.1 PAS domain S-box-containing protein [Halopenitus persicus]
MNYYGKSERVGDAQGGDSDDAGRVILLVDPSSVADQHAAKLEREFGQVVTEGTVQDALTQLSTTYIDCVVSTYELPDEDGLELLKQVRTEYPTIPVILWPDSGDEHIASEAIAANVTGYVPRCRNSPTDYDPIVNRIHDAISTRPDSLECDRIDTAIPLLSAVCCDLMQAQTRADGFQLTVQRVCEYTDWDYGEVWRPDKGQEALTLEASYPVDEQFTSFATMSDSITFQPDEGLPGRVWATKSEEWISDVSTVPVQKYIRTAAVEETHLKTAFGVPVRSDGSVDAVIVFYSVNDLPDESPLRTMVNAVQRVLNKCSSEHPVLERNESGSLLPFSFQENEETKQLQGVPLRILADHVNVTVWMATPDFEEIIFTDPNFERITGISPDEFQENPRSLLDIVHPDDRDDVQYVWENRTDEYTLEFRIQTAEGEIRWLKERGTPVKLDDELQYFVGTAKDITERKQQEQELRQQRELLRHTEELARTGGWIADLDTGKQRWTKGAKAIHEVPSDFEPTIDAGIEFFHSDDQETIERVLNRCAETGEPYDVELRIITAEDRERWVRATGKPVREDGEITKVCGAIQDITDRKNRELELNREREHLQQTERLAKSGGWIYNCETESLQRTDGTRRLFGLPADHEWSLEESFEYYHPDDRDTRIHAFERCRRTGEPYEIEVRIVTSQGDQRWIHEHGEQITENGVKKVQGAVRDITTRKRYENALNEVNTAARDLLTDETDTEIAHTVVNTATNILDGTGVAVYLYDEQSEELAPIAASEEIKQLLDKLPRFAPGDSIVWDVFASQQPAHYDDVRTADDVYRADTPIRSEYIQPLGEYGILIVGDTEIGAFSDLTSDIVTILASTAEAALTRAERTQALHKRERKSQRQARQLEQVEQLNEHIRSIIKAVVQAETHKTIKQIICDSLATHESFKGVWIGEPDLAMDEVVMTTTSGPIEQYLESVSLELEAENTLPAVQAIRDRTSIVEGNIAEQPHQDDWQHPALLYDFRSVISVPLIYNDILYGVLTIYSTQPEVFDDPIVSVLTELGELIGYVLNSLTQRHARLADEMIELTFVVSGADDLFVEMASQLDTSVHIENVSVRFEDRFLVHFTVSDTDPEDVMGVAESLPSIENIKLIGDDSSPRFEVITLGECVGTQIERLGARLRKVTVDEGSCELQVTIPHNRDIEAFVRHLNEQYPNAELTTQQNNTDTTSSSYSWLLDDCLTEKQKETLTTAYYSGYFDQTRKQKGGEIAESLGISQPGFAKQLRAAQYNLLSAILE